MKTLMLLPLFLPFQHSVPVFTLPFTLVTQVIINVGGFRGYLYRVEDMSYPEKQAYDWYTRIRVKTQDEVIIKFST